MVSGFGFNFPLGQIAIQIFAGVAYQLAKSDKKRSSPPGAQHLEMLYRASEILSGLTLRHPGLLVRLRS